MFRRKRARKSDPVTDVNEDKWYAVGFHDMHQCCDCGLVHDLSYRWEKGRLFERWQRNESATRRARSSKDGK